MREAEPRTLLRAGAADSSALSEPRHLGEPGFRPPRRPAGASGQARLRSGEYGTYQVEDSSSYPAAMTGKVFARDRSGNYGCSATVVNSSGNNVIFTAAHCVRTRRWGWAKKFIFIPAYRNGASPFGKWDWKSLYVPAGWSNFKYDYAAVALDRRNGQNVESQVGAAGLAWNYHRNTDYRAFGYPFDSFNGERMMACFSPLVEVDGSSRNSPTGIACHMGSGSSGGGWLIEDQYLASVTSYGYDADPYKLYGPYFNKRANKFLNWVERQ